MRTHPLLRTTYTFRGYDEAGKLHPSLMSGFHEPASHFSGEYERTSLRHTFIVACFPVRSVFYVKYF